jgi:hypothetical protein
LAAIAFAGGLVIHAERPLVALWAREPGGLTTPNQINPHFPDRFVDQIGATMILI